jgi:hypothetical protein
VIACNNKGSKKSNDNTRKLRQLAYVRSRSRRSSRLLRPHDRQLVGLNNNSSKLKKLPKEARGDLLRQLLRQAQKREQLRSLKIVVRSYKLQQAYYYLNHDTAEQLSSQPNIDSCIYVSMPIELNSKKHCDYSYRM